MTDDRSNENSHPAWARVSAAFDELAELEPAAREARLEALVDENPALAREVAGLLAGLDDTPTFLEQPALDLQASPEPAATALPESIGPYRIRERLGSGGRGTVYRAVREDGNLVQEVAIKIVRAAAGDPTRLGRFAQEARLLSRLDHPGIARPLDAGTLDEETAYLVMEYVDGLRIDRYCGEQELGLEARLRLLVELARAAHFAHRNLVVHRDIKPSNVLVDQTGKPRLLDFGIARLLSPTDDGQTTLTITGQYALTPRYASPEQFRGETITTATDVYALGALAYELLAGEPALSLDDLSLPEMIERVCERRPRAPSAAAGDPRLRGDLDAIVLMALRKEPDRRYASAGDFAEDLERYLAGEPVLAHADTFAYRAGKFLRRNRLAVGTGLLITAALVTLTTVASIQAVRADRERARAEVEAQRATSVLGFFQEMLASVDPARAQGEEPSVRDFLDQTAAGLAGATLDPIAQATVQETAASTYLSLGFPDAGLPLAEAASIALTDALGADHPRTLAARHAEARFHLYNANYTAAIEILEPTFEARRRVLGDAMDTMSSLHNLAIAYAGIGEVERALELDLIQLEIVERLSGKGSPDALTTLGSVAHGHYALGRLDEARDLFGQIFEGQRAHLGERHPTTLSALHNYATLSRQTGAIDEAEALFRNLVSLRREVLGEQHAQTLNSLHNLGEVYLNSDRADEAAPHIEGALAGRREALAEGHPDVVDSLIALTRVHLARDELAAAQATADEALALAEAHLEAGSGHFIKAKEAVESVAAALDEG